jgi:hypothetical protein
MSPLFQFTFPHCFNQRRVPRLTADVMGWLAGWQAVEQKKQRGADRRTNSIKKTSGPPDGFRFK